MAKKGVKDLSSATTAEASAALGVSERTLQTWRGEGAPFRNAGGRIVYDLPALIRWRIDREASSTRKATASNNPMDEWRALRVERQRVAMETERKELLRTIAVEHALQHITGHMSAIFETMPEDFLLELDSYPARDEFALRMTRQSEVFQAHLDGGVQAFWCELNLAEKALNAKSEHKTETTGALPGPKAAN